MVTAVMCNGYVIYITHFPCTCSDALTTDYLGVRS